VPHHHAVGLQSQASRSAPPSASSSHPRRHLHPRDPHPAGPDPALPSESRPGMLKPSTLLVGHGAETFPGDGGCWGGVSLTGLSRGPGALQPEGSPGAQLTCRSGSPSTHWNSLWASWRPIQRSKEMLGSMDVMKAASDGRGAEDQPRQVPSQRGPVGAGGTYPAPGGWRWWPGRHPGSRTPASPPATSLSQLCCGR